MSDEADNKAAAVGRALADLVPSEAVRRSVALQSRGNVSLQLGAFVTGEQLNEERTRVLAVDSDDASDP